MSLRSVLRSPVLALATGFSVGAILTASGAAFGQGPPELVAPGPTPTIAPGAQICNLNPPHFALQANYPFAGFPVGWWAGGLQPNTQAVITVTDTVNPRTTKSVFKVFTTPNTLCQAMGTVVLPENLQYQMELTGVSAVTGEPVTINLWPFPLPSHPITPTPTPSAAPLSPTNIRAIQVNRTTARVHWDASSVNETSFIVVTKTGEFTATPRTASLDIGGLTAGQIYCFRVYAENGGGRSTSDLNSVDCLLVEPNTRADR